MSSRKPTTTSSFGTGRRESHDASAFYARFSSLELSNDDEIGVVPDAVLAEPARLGDSRDMAALPDKSVALVVTSPPYFVGKEYELAVTGSDRAIPTTYLDYLTMLRDVFAECARVLEPGGRIAVNVANLGRKPYRSLAADVVGILQDDLGMLLRGEILWQKGKTSSSSCAWGSFASPANPVLRDVTERVIVASKGRFDRALSQRQRAERGLPHVATVSNDEFVETTKDVWELDAESARRVGHPAPFPIDLPRKLIELYTYRGDVVLDPFLGSGATLVAAERTARRGVGFDLDAEYIALAGERLAREQDRLQRLVDGCAEDDHELRDEHYLRHAVAAGRKTADLAHRALLDAGFDVETNPRLPGSPVGFDFAATSVDGGRWFVELAGSFTTAKAGMTRTDAVWRTIGRLSVAGRHDERAPVIVMTPLLPKPGSEGDRALRALGPAGLFDAVEILDSAGLERLKAYAGGEVEPQPGFWTEADLGSAGD